MNTYLLFIYGTFENHEEIDFFCMDVLSDSEVIKSLKYVIENGENIIVIFETDVDYLELSTELYKLMNNETVVYYFLFNRDTLITAHIPERLKDFIFKPSTESNDDYIEIKTEPVPEKSKVDLNLDYVLDKIEKSGLESLN
ncbi:MAG: hypothetical protein E6R13_07800, partial [Spirochaetes bacterium]